MNTIPSFLNLIPNLKRLDLSNNPIQYFPIDIHLPHLTQLYIKGGSIKELPEEVVNFPNLQLLSITKNKVEKLPDNIGDLKHLKALILSSNRLQELPDSIFNLKHLKELNLKGNQFSDAYKNQIRAEFSESLKLYL